jgi:nicotinate-nucleotide adenylyltransferase
LKRIAVLGGTFDPVHNGHLTVARALADQFGLDQFVFLPAFHAPHKPDRNPTSAYHRYAMLAIASREDPKIVISTLELEKQTKRYTVETLPELQMIYDDSKLFFVMGADSWMDIRTWKEWETVLKISDHIVVSRPGYDLSFEHVTHEIQNRVVDLRSKTNENLAVFEREAKAIYITDAVQFDTSATELRYDLSDGTLDQKDDIPSEVANYIEKYQLYK